MAAVEEKMIELSMEEGKSGKGGEDDDPTEFDYCMVFEEQADGSIGQSYVDPKTGDIFDFAGIVKRIEDSGCYVCCYRSKHSSYKKPLCGKNDAHE